MKDKIADFLIISVFVIALAIIVFEFAGGADWLIQQAEAASAQTTVEVVITEEVSSQSTSSVNVFAAVPCNEVNCQESLDTSPSLWSRFVTWFSGLW